MEMNWPSQFNPCVSVSIRGSIRYNPFMKQSKDSLTLKRSEVIDMYFLEHRAKVIDIAAFLDRVDRSKVDSGTGGDDFRMSALGDSLKLLLDGKPNRAKRVLELLSDPTTEPIPKAPMKGALGAFRKT
jgi:hypothetical protein